MGPKPMRWVAWCVNDAAGTEMQLGACSAALRPTQARRGASPRALREPEGGAGGGAAAEGTEGEGRCRRAGRRGRDAGPTPKPRAAPRGAKAKAQGRAARGQRETPRAAPRGSNAKAQGRAAGNRSVPFAAILLQVHTGRH